MEKVNLFWFRRDLRLHDNAGLYQALQSGLPVIPIFIFDPKILDRLEEKNDRRVAFIHAALEEMQQQLAVVGSSLEVYHGTPAEVWDGLAEKYPISHVFTNHDYEPYAQERDDMVKQLLEAKGAQFQTFKDQVIFEQSEVVKDDGKPYTVFTPYSRKWKSALAVQPINNHPSELHLQHFFKQSPQPIPELASMGFQPNETPFPAKVVEEELLQHYQDRRNFPGIAGTSKLGVHLRFGTISIRQLAKQALAVSETFLNELIWRDFYHMILWHFPRVGRSKAFKPEYDGIEWRQDNGEFAAWCEGRTGYPIVDAGMRELNATGFMHNRVRMITASFLTKHLLLDWRLGEAYFAQKLLDFDLAANNGGWQWAAGSGCDAAPYFRIFNPRLQTEKFDKQLQYIRHWIPELDSFGYPKPIVDHEFARKRCLDVYGKALKKG